MLLIDKIIHVDDSSAKTRSVVKVTWPFCNGRNVQSLVLIELVAQTAGIHNGWIRERLHGPGADKRGWIVGIRKARLLVDSFPIGTEFISRAKNQMAFEGFREISGMVENQKKVVAKITLQLLRADTGE
jgi:predicted hotdog family 3-hydroxylacyl-ACP dehydratase